MQTAEHMQHYTHIKTIANEPKPQYADLVQNGFAGIHSELDFPALPRLCGAQQTKF